MNVTSGGADAAEKEAARRRRVLLVAVLLLVALPLYLIAASIVVGYLTAPRVEDGEAVKPLHWLAELMIYLVLGLIWALPMKRLVLGVGRQA